jgi:hypothetical protein
MSGNIIPPIQYDFTGDDQDLVIAINSQKVAHLAKKVFFQKCLKSPIWCHLFYKQGYPKTEIAKNQRK